MKDTRVKASPCPSCGSMLDAATALDDKSTPSPGDISVCIDCHSTLQFNGDMSTRLLSAEEFIELPVDIRTQVHEFVEALREVKRERMGSHQGGD